VVFWLPLLLGERG